MNGERCRDANLPFEPSMRRVDGVLAIAITESATVNCTIANFGRANYLVRRINLEPSMRYADGVLSISKIGSATSDCILIYFWQNEAKMVNTFKGDRLNAALTAAVRPFGTLATLLLRPTRGPCD